MKKMFTIPIIDKTHRACSSSRGRKGGRNGDILGGRNGDILHPAFYWQPSEVGYATLCVPLAAKSHDRVATIRPHRNTTVVSPSAVATLPLSRNSDVFCQPLRGVTYSPPLPARPALQPSRVRIPCVPLAAKSHHRALTVQPRRNNTANSSRAVLRTSGRDRSSHSAVIPSNGTQRNSVPYRADQETPFTTASGGTLKGVAEDCVPYETEYPASLQYALGGPLRPVLPAGGPVIMQPVGRGLKDE
jgi:hypothetical protein